LAMTLSTAWKRSLTGPRCTRCGALAALSKKWKVISD
jgi:hypothetical protein